jgi:GT2 family glycosyltransferase
MGRPAGTPALGHPSQAQAVKGRQRCPNGCDIVLAEVALPAGSLARRSAGRPVVVLFSVGRVAEVGTRRARFRRSRAVIYRSPFRPDSRIPGEIRVSTTIVICSYNRIESLSRTLDTLAVQDTDREWDVLVIDNNSDDGTSEMVEGRQGSFPVSLQLARETRQGLSYARNLGLELAKGRALVFIDDDVDCPPDFVSAWARCFDDPSVCAAGGRIVPSLPSETPEWLREEIGRTIGGPTSRYDFGDDAADVTEGGAVELPFGANMAVLRETARSVVGFDPELGWGSDASHLISGEDTQFFVRIQQSGERIVYWPEAQVLHRIPAERITLEYFERWYVGLGRSSVIISEPNAWRRIVIGADAVIDIVRARWMRLTDRSPATELRALRRAAKARGRLAQLTSR